MVCILLLLLIVYFYALLFYASVVMAFGANQDLTLKHYRVVFTEGLKAIKIGTSAGMEIVAKVAV